MAESSDFKFQLSLKNTRGDMLNIRADSADEFEANITAAFGENITDLAMASFNGWQGQGDVAAQPVAAAPAQTAPPAQPAPAAQPAQPSQPGPEAPICKCQQPKKWVPSGVSKRTGKPYNGFWGCPQNPSCS